MIIAKTITELQKARTALDGNVGFVPTMGALHKGHISLINSSVQENQHTIVSIFVNPTQFLEGEDLDSYPRKDEADIQICKLAKVDILFMPSIEQMYEGDELSISAPMIGGYILEGAKRPGHFDGMLQVVMKLLNLSNATKAYFGKKDAQQLSLIIQMVRSYYMSVEIVPCEIIREPSGLALSSRNTYLSKDEKERALTLSKSIRKATELIINGELKSDVIKSKMFELLIQTDSVEYVAIVDRDFRQLEHVEIGNSIILVAAWIGSTRLIDNIWI